MKKLKANSINLFVEADDRSFYLSFDYNSFRKLNENIKVGKGGFDLAIDVKKFYVFVSDFYCEEIINKEDMVRVKGRVRGNFGKYNSLDDLLREAL